jgi:hypothetical protein
MRALCKNDETSRCKCPVVGYVGLAGRTFRRLPLPQWTFFPLPQWSFLPHRHPRIVQTHFPSTPIIRNLRADASFLRSTA